MVSVELLWRDAVVHKYRCTSTSILDDPDYPFCGHSCMDRRGETASFTETEIDFLKITFICPPLEMSGGARVVCIYADELSRLGHHVSIIAPRPKPESLRKKFRSLKRGEGWPSVTETSFLDGKNIPYIRTAPGHMICDRDVPNGDVVIATWWETAEWVANLSVTKGRKIYFIQHHEIFDNLPERSRETYKLPLHKIVVAKWLMDLMETEYGDASVSLVPNSVDRLQFFAPIRSKQNTPTVGTIYSTVNFKGVSIAFEALNLIRSNIPNFKTICFGSEKINEKLPLPPNSQFHYSPSQDNIRNIYAACDVWLTASRTEGFNLPALEAMACRTPVVSTKTGWPAESIKNDINGILTEVDDTKALATGVEKILKLPVAQWHKMSTAAYDTSLYSSWAASAKQFESAIQPR